MEPTAPLRSVNVPGERCNTSKTTCQAASTYAPNSNVSLRNYLTQRRKKKWKMIRAPGQNTSADRPSRKRRETTLSKKRNIRTLGHEST